MDRSAMIRGALRFLCRATLGLPMRRVEAAMDRSGRWTFVWRDRLGRYWLARGRWSPFRKKATFDMAGCWTEA